MNGMFRVCNSFRLECFLSTFLFSLGEGRSEVTVINERKVPLLGY